MRLILFTIFLFTLFGCGDDASTFKPPTFEPRAESEIEDCEVSGIGQEGNESLSIRSMEELEALHNQPCGNYPGIISISVDGIENLKGLQNLRRVEGLDVSFLSDLRTFDGIEALEITGTRSLFITDNPKLTSIEALNAPKVLALAPDSHREYIWLTISDNPKLESLKGLENLRDLEKSRVNIASNASLKNLEGLNNIQALGFVKIQNNYGLESLDGLDSVESGGSLVLLFNSLLRNISGARSE